MKAVKSKQSRRDLHGLPLTVARLELLHLLRFSFIFGALTGVDWHLHNTVARTIRYSMRVPVPVPVTTSIVRKSSLASASRLQGYHAEHHAVCVRVRSSARVRGCRVGARARARSWTRGADVSRATRHAHMPHVGTRIASTAHRHICACACHRSTYLASMSGSPSHRLLAATHTFRRGVRLL